jgi:flagellar hook-associated protein 2
MSTSASSLNGSSSSGIDVQGTVDQLIYVERAPERLMQTQQSQLDSQTSALRDLQTKLGTLEDAVFALKDFTGALNSQTAQSSNAAVLTASADSGAISGTHTIVVTNLATSSSYYSNPITDPNFTFGAGSTMKLQVGTGATSDLTLDGKTLDQAAQYIMGQRPEVSATVINDANGARLSIVSKTSGLPGAVHITADNSTLGWQSSSEAKNAQLTVDGVPVESSTNKVSGAISGVTLTLSSQSPATPILLTVGPDTGRAAAAVNGFVAAYNSVITGVNSQFAYDSTTKQAGILSGDSMLRELQSGLLSDMSYAVAGNGSIQSLRDLGVNMNNDGTLTTDNAALNDSLANHYSDLQKFFQVTPTESTPSGFALHLGANLTAINDSISGPIAVDIHGVDTSSKDIQNQIDDFEVRIADRQKRLMDEYTRINVMLQAFTSTQAQLTAQLGSLSSMYTTK